MEDLTECTSPDSIGGYFDGASTRQPTLSESPSALSISARSMVASTAATRRTRTTRPSRRSTTARARKGELGCTYPFASNYDPDADVNDGSCTLPPGLKYGCTYPNADNFDPKAAFDDGSCSFDGEPSIVWGCTYVDAPNFDANATMDDGSCSPGLCRVGGNPGLGFNDVCERLSDGECPLPPGPPGPPSPRGQPSDWAWRWPRTRVATHDARRGSRVETR